MDQVAAASPRAFTVAAFDAMDTQRVGALAPEQHAWNVSGGPRVEAILDSMRGHAAKAGPGPLTVVNLSGLNEGKPDPVLHDLFKAQVPPGALSWYVVDHPRSQTFHDPAVSGWLAQRAIAAVPHDHRDDAPPAVPAADIVLCTEIIEHLDYSQTLKLLRTCHATLKPGGMMVLTTPNATFLGYRVLFALGRWDFLHFNDEPEHIERGTQGHTIYYDAARIARLLRALGFRRVAASTFNAGHGPGEMKSFPRRAAAVTLRALTRLVPNAGQVLKVVAYK